VPRDLNDRLVDRDLVAQHGGEACHAVEANQADLDPAIARRAGHHRDDPAFGKDHDGDLSAG
jgi:hypothetical protein